MREQSQLLTQTMGIIYPSIIMFGIYIIINGHKTPGGGFQGGAILASIFIIQYIIDSGESIRLPILIRLEKILYFCILLFPILFILNFSIDWGSLMNTLYLITMNILIGIKVCCGLSIIFFRFVLFESR